VKRARALPVTVLAAAALAAGAATAQSRSDEATEVGAVKTSPITAACDVATLQAFARVDTTIVTAQRLTAPVPLLQLLLYNEQL